MMALTTYVKLLIESTEVKCSAYFDWYKIICIKIIWVHSYYNAKLDGVMYIHTHPKTLHQYQPTSNYFVTLTKNQNGPWPYYEKRQIKCERHKSKIIDFFPFHSFIELKLRKYSIFHVIFFILSLTVYFIVNYKESELKAMKPN